VLAVLLSLVAVTAEESGKVETVQGQVDVVDASAKAILVTPTDSGKQMRLRIDAATKIVKDGGPIGLAELRRGDVVVVNYRHEAGTPLALSIGVQPSKTS
jgi:hypothetical protein